MSSLIEIMQIITAVLWTEISIRCIEIVAVVAVITVAGEERWVCLLCSMTIFTAVVVLTILTDSGKEIEAPSLERPPSVERPGTSFT